MKPVQLSHYTSDIADEQLESQLNKALKVQQVLEAQTGKGSDMLGWLHWPSNIDTQLLEEVKSAAQKIQKQSEVLVVIGIGGSYLGAKAALEFLSSQQEGVEVIFAGQHLSSLGIQQILDYVRDKEFSINMISKSGTTTEPAIAFRIFRQLMERKYGKEEAANRIYATTDADHGALRDLAEQEGYTTFSVPDDVGGRYSVLTAVGLLPMAAAGIDIHTLIQGAQLAEENCGIHNRENDVLMYAALRHRLYNDDKKIEILVNYEPQLKSLGSWWQQLFGESEGKNNLGLFPVSSSFTTDLHSLGQYIQEGERHLFETVLFFENPTVPVDIPSDDQNLDGLNYLAGKSLHHVNQKAYEGTLKAHEEGGVPNIIFQIHSANPESLGYLFYFFEYSCAISGYMLDVNPFDQPGVEAYKRNMFELLGRP
jgi:glucose-6-phosphate isomerase